MIPLVWLDKQKYVKSPASQHPQESYGIITGFVAASVSLCPTVVP